MDSSKVMCAGQVACTDKKENLIFLIDKKIQSGSVAMSVYEKMRKYEEAISHI
jgi:hypothetical protein